MLTGDPREVPVSTEVGDGATSDGASSGADDGALSGSAPGRSVLWAALFAAAVVVPLLRSSHPPIAWTLWAEDGSVYLQDLHDDGAIAPLLRSFAGYAQLPSRLLVIPAGALPLAWAAPYAAVVGTAVTAAVAALTVHLFRDWITVPLMRVLVGAWMVLTPVAGAEVSANIVDLIWVYLAAVPFVLLSEARGRSALVARCGLVLAAATGTVASVVFVPLALGVALLRRTRAAMAVLACLLGGLVIQAVVAAAPDAPRFVRIDRSPVDLVRATPARVFGSPLVGHDLAAELWTDHGRWFSVVATLVVLVALVAVGWGAQRPAQIVAALLVVHALVVFAFVVEGRGTQEMHRGAAFNAFAHSRFSYVPAVLLAGAFAVLASRRREDAARSGRWAQVLLVAHAAAVIAVSFGDVGYRGVSRDWRDSVAAAEVACAAPDADDSTEVIIRQDQLRFYAMTLTCGDLVG